MAEKQYKSDTVSLVRKVFNKSNYVKIFMYFYKKNLNYRYGTTNNSRHQELVQTTGYMIKVCKYIL